MPIRAQHSQVSKEHPSQFFHHALQGKLQSLFRTAFQIPRGIKVEGIVFDDRILYDTLRDKELLPLIQQRGVNPYTNGPIEPMEFPLPPAFESGSLSVAMAGQSQGSFQSVIRFDNSPGLAIHYQTHGLGQDNLCALISHSVIMASLPKETLQKVKDKGSMVVVHQDVNKSGHNMGYENCTLYQLMWDNHAQIIQATETKIPIQKDYWKQHALFWRNAIIKSPGGVFFVSD